MQSHSIPQHGYRLTAVLFACALAFSASAQEAATEQLSAAAKQYQQDRRQLIADNLQLTAAEAEGFWPIYAKLERDIAQIHKARRELIAEFGENYDQMTDAMAKKILYDRLELDALHPQLMKQYLPKFEQVLPIKKLALYYQIESKIHVFVAAGIAEEIPLIK